MKSQQEIHDDLHSIRDIMEKSSKFLSLSGLSGILAGIYALAGAGAALFLARNTTTPDFPDNTLHIIGKVRPIVWQLGIIATFVLLASLVTGILLSARKAKRQGTTLWTPSTYRVIINLIIPLTTGGIVIITQLLLFGNYEFVAPGCLIFYGLALLAASPNLYDEVRYLGYSEIALGIICGLLPGYGLFFWATGFGIFHIFYGALMFRKYDR
jgi:hypothetical protein